MDFSIFMKTLKKMLASVLSVATLLTCGVVGTSPALAAGDVADSNGIRAMSFNIRYLLDDPYDAITYTKAQRSKVVLDQIKYYSPDVLGVQEDTTEWRDVLAAGLSGYTVYKGAEIAGSGYDASYNEIFYKTDRFTLVEGATKWLTDTPDQKSSIQEQMHIRRVNYVILQDKTTGEQFCFANTHLHNGANETAAQLRVQQAGYLMDILDGVKAEYPNIPVILVGDFNYQNQTSDPSMLNTIVNAGFSDARAVADTVEADVNATWNTGYGNPANYGNRSTIMDYCFVSADLPVARFRVATEKFPDAEGNMICTSDHFPLVVDVAKPILPDEDWGEVNENEYRIYDAADLLAFAKELREGNTFEGTTVYLCNDIALNTGTVYSAASDEQKANPFSGTFDGQSYVISGLTTYDTEGHATGLIPYVADTALIQNVTIINSSFTGTACSSAVVGSYSASQKDAVFTMKNVHVENTSVTGISGTAGILGMMGSFTATGVKVNMEDITFTDGSVTAEHSSGGIIGEILNEEGNDYANGVTLTMNRIVSSAAMSFTGYVANAPYGDTTANCVKAGSLIGAVAGFLSIKISNIFIGGSIEVPSNTVGSTPFIGYIEAINTANVKNDNATTNSILTIDRALATPTMKNLHAWLYVKENSKKWAPTVQMTNILQDKSKGTPTSRKVYNSGADQFPAVETDHKFATNDLIGKQFFDGWVVADENSYPVPTVRPVRLVGYQSSYTTDVTKGGKDDYSIRLIATLNDAFYDYAGFENITITYKDGNGKPVEVPKADYRCKYAYHSVIGVDQNGNKQTYAAEDFEADCLIALEITGIPKGVTEFTVTLNAFAGKDGVSFAGITRTVSVKVS